jgi:predicted Ser/Thr protein kinase
MPSSEPRKIGRYNVERLLGAGGMGAVYLAEDPALKRRLAVKVVQAAGAPQEILVRFQREAEISARLNHPNVITIYDVGEDPAVGPFIAMEFVDGSSLADLVRAGRFSGAEERLRVLIPAMHALDAAHRAGIVHRDIKPGNLMVARDGRVKLMDFGVARSEDLGLTATGSVIGTPSYLAPEQLKGADPSAATDRYAFAVMTFETFTNAKPYVGATTSTLLYNIAHNAPVFPEAMPGALRAVFERALAKEPDDRFPDLASFLRAVIAATVPNRAERDRLLATVGPELRGDDSVAPPGSANSTTTLLVPGAPSAEGMRPATVIFLGAGAIAAVAAAGLGAWALGRGSSPAALSPQPAVAVVHEQPAAQPSPSAVELASAPTAPLAPAAEPDVVPSPPQSIAPPVSADVGLAKVAVQSAAEERRPTASALRDAVREALHDRGMADVEVRVDADRHGRLANLKDDAEAEQARAVVRGVSEDPLTVETSIRAVKRAARSPSRRPPTRREDVVERNQGEPATPAPPSWNIHREGSEPTD